MISDLIKYQSVDAELKAIEQELIASEDRKKALTAKKFLDTVNDSLAELDAKAGDLDTAYTRYTGIYAKLAETQKEFVGSEDYTGEDEIAFMTKKAQELLNELKDLEKRILMLKEEIISLSEQYSALKKKTISYQKQYRECAQKYNALKESKAAAQSEIQARLAQTEKDIDPELMALYKKKRSGKIFPILYAYSGKGFCPQCRTEISRLSESTLKTKSYVECDNCGRILYAAQTDR